MDVSGKNVLVIGLARSGIAAAKLLCQRGAVVSVNDSKTEEKLGDVLKPLENLPVEYCLGAAPDDFIDGKDFIVVSPGVPTELPYFEKARKLGIPVIAEAELGYRMSPCPMVAITGTNGKTTSTTLMGKIFEREGFRTHVVGNIGLPLTEAVPEMKEQDRIVMEVSSFMLETTVEFHPRVSAILNITEDHLNRHHTMEVYTDTKCRIFEAQTGDDAVVLNYDQLPTRILAERVKCRVLFFSRLEEVQCGACVHDGQIVYRDGKGGETVICAPSEIRIPGRHNLENALACVAMAMAMGVSAESVRDALKTFEGVEHRIETTRTVSGVRFINDSKGTNVDAALQAVWSMEAPTVLIAGGYDKHTDFVPLYEGFTEWIKAVVLIGDTADQLEGAARQCGFTAIYRASSMKDAVEMSYRLASPGWNVLLSPACASFDMFSDYEQRGRVFKALAWELAEKEN